MSFERAMNKPRYARIALVGPPLGDCEVFALEIAAGISGTGRVALIDSGFTADALGESFEFDRWDISDTPKVAWIRHALESAYSTYDCLIVNGLTQAWLSLRGEIDRQKNVDGIEPNAAWFKGREAYRRMIDSLQAWPGHVIVIAHTAVEYRVDESGAAPVGRPVSLAPLDDGSLYRDWSIVGRTDFDHSVTFELSAFPRFRSQRFEVDELVPVLPALAEWLGAVDSEGSE